MRDQSQRRRHSKYGKPGSKKKGKKSFNKGPNGNRSARNGNVNGNSIDAQPSQGPGVCVKCGFPAPDGKLCNFHRSLLNALRNDFGKKGSRNYSPAI